MKGIEYKIALLIYPEKEQSAKNTAIQESARTCDWEKYSLHFHPFSSHLGKNIKLLWQEYRGLKQKQH